MTFDRGAVQYPRRTAPASVAPVRPLLRSGHAQCRAPAGAPRRAARWRPRSCKPRTFQQLQISEAAMHGFRSALSPSPGRGGWRHRELACIASRGQRPNNIGDAINEPPATARRWRGIPACRSHQRRFHAETLGYLLASRRRAVRGLGEGRSVCIWWKRTFGRRRGVRVLT
jgi:hypothetical protein